jgi:hypothetical protein
VRRLAVVAPLVGLAAIGVLVFAAVARFDRWDAPAFVLPVYVAALAAVVGTLAARRAGGAPLRRLRVALWIAAVVMLLWVWTPWLRPLVTWYLRQLATWRFRT